MVPGLSCDPLGPDLFPISRCCCSGTWKKTLACSRRPSGSSPPPYDPSGGAHRSPAQGELLTLRGICDDRPVFLPTPRASLSTSRVVQGIYSHPQTPFRRAALPVASFSFAHRINFRDPGVSKRFFSSAKCCLPTFFPVTPL